MTTRSNTLSALLIQQSPDGIIFADTSGRIEIWNAAAERIFGYPESEALAQSLDIIIPERLRAAHWQGFEQAIKTKTTKHQGGALPTKGLCRDGTTIYVEMGFAVVLDATGAALGATAQVRDITERFETERATRKHLRELQQQLQVKSVVPDAF